MTQEKKQLLLIDLCARIFYGVKILHEGWNYEWDQELSTVERVVGIDDKFVYTKVIDTYTGEEYRDDKWPISTFDDKPFLRPMTSMTKEETKEFMQLWGYDIMLDWLNEHHFDYRHLIEKCLALEAPKDMYN